jgi:transposase
LAGKVKAYQTGRVVLVMDNALHHKSASALAVLSLFEHRMMAVWLPPYCSKPIPIELFWCYLKDHAYANKLQDSIEEVAKAVVKIMIAQNETLSDPMFHVSQDL